MNTVHLIMPDNDMPDMSLPRCMYAWHILVFLVHHQTSQHE